MKYRLFPAFSERKEGNAVPIYLRITFEQSDAERRYWTETPKKWNALPVEEIPLTEAKEFIKRYQNFYRQFELGARRKTAEWNYTLDQGSIIDVMLPDAQTMRNYVPMLLLRARVALAEGRFADASHWLETGFAFSQQVGSGPFLINSLVGIACANQFADCLFDYVALPEAPNLYWPLTAMPRPLIDLRHAMEMEQSVMEMQFPDLATVEQAHSPEQWDAALKRVRAEIRRLVASDNEAEANRFKPIAGAGIADPASGSPDLARARKHLMDARKLSAAQSPPCHQRRFCCSTWWTYHQFRDDAFKARSATPMPAAFADAEARRRAPTRKPNSCLTPLLPL